jgi:hypothetical protein
MMEICHSLGGGSEFVAAPLVPTLVQENRLGFDAYIDVVHAGVFLQFKRSQRLGASNAKEWPEFLGPYYRFPLRNTTASPQHNRLCALEASRRQHFDFVYYAAPVFDTYEELSANFVTGRVADNSVFFHPMKAGTLPVNTKHCIAYTTPADARKCSEPEAIEGQNWRSVRSDIVAALQQSEPVPLLEYLSGVRADLAIDNSIGDSADALMAVAEGCMALGIQLVLIGGRDTG